MWEYAATSNYHSLQATLSQQTNARLQYFLTYTFSKALGATNVNETDGAGGLDPFDARNRTWGVLPTDRTHLANLSYNWMVPDLVERPEQRLPEGPPERLAVLRDLDLPERPVPSASASRAT